MKIEEDKEDVLHHVESGGNYFSYIGAAKCADIETFTHMGSRQRCGRGLYDDLDHQGEWKAYHPRLVAKKGGQWRKGAWTRRLFLDIRLKYHGRASLYLEFYVTQVLTGYGCFCRFERSPD